jgi:hypothetical protein
MNSKQRIARYASLVCLAGATVQIVYGLLAVLFAYPVIAEPRFELVWALAIVGMAGGVVGWLALDVARPRWVAVFGGWLAVLGCLIRVVVSVVRIVNPSAAVDAAIVGTILLTFAGISMLGIGTLLGKRLTGWRAWALLFTVAAELVAASFYSIDRVVHFVLLGLLWGPTWMLVGYLVRSQAGKQAQVARAGTGFIAAGR